MRLIQGVLVSGLLSVMAHPSLAIGPYGSQVDLEVLATCLPDIKSIPAGVNVRKAEDLVSAYGYLSEDQLKRTLYRFGTLDGMDANGYTRDEMLAYCTQLNQQDGLVQGPQPEPYSPPPSPQLATPSGPLVPEGGALSIGPAYSPHYGELQAMVPDCFTPEYLACMGYDAAQAEAGAQRLVSALMSGGDSRTLAFKRAGSTCRAATNPNLPRLPGSRGCISESPQQASPVRQPDMSAIEDARAHQEAVERRIQERNRQIEAQKCRRACSPHVLDEPALTQCKADCSR